MFGIHLKICHGNILSFVLNVAKKIFLLLIVLIIVN